MAIGIDDIIDIDQKKTWLTVNVRSWAAWPATSLACAPLDSRNVSTRQQCDDLDVPLAGGSRNCYLHGPATTPQRWAEYMSDKKAYGAPVPCRSRLKGLSLETFKQQYWYPRFSPDNRIDDISLLDEYIKTDVDANGNVWFMHRRLHQMTIKEHWDVSQYPFDKHTASVTIQPYDSDYYPQVAFKNNVDVPSLGWDFTTGQLNARQIGQVVSGFYIRSISDAQVPRRNYLGMVCNPTCETRYKDYRDIKVTFEFDRDAGPPFYKYGGSALIIWWCSYMLFYISMAVAPAAAGSSLAAALLIFVAQRLDYAVIKALPEGTGYVYIRAYQFTFMLTMLTQLPWHMVRMQQFHEKLPTKARATTVGVRVAFPFLAFLGQTVCYCLYFSSSDGIGIAMIVITILWSFLVIYVMYRMWSMIDSSEEYGDLKWAVTNDCMPKPSEPEEAAEHQL